MEPITFGSVCSGIGAPEVAWGPLGWRSVFLSEIERSPRAVLEYRHRAVDAVRAGAASRGVPLWGDFTAMRMRFFRRLGIRLPAILVGGTPCQAFSVAGLRRSLADARGNLSLEFVRLANAIDNERRRLGRGGITIVWENVPGVLSTKDNAFGYFLAGLVGADAPLVPPPGQRWTDAGMVVGPRRAAAWRILDSQYFGLAQRRERVFVVACPLDGADPAEILLEQDGLRRDSPPRRQAQEDIAGTLGDIPPGGGWRFGADEAAANQLVAAPLTAALGRRAGVPDGADTPGHLIAFGGNNTSGPIDVATTLNACHTASGRQDFETETFVAHVAPTIDANYGRLYGQDHQHANAGYGLFVAHTLRGEGFDASEDGTGRGTPLVPAAWQCHGSNVGEMGTLRAGNRHVTGGVPFVVDALAPTLTARMNRNGGANADRNGGANADRNGAVTDEAGVRRLMPVECERLQGFPDHYTMIPATSRRVQDGVEIIRPRWSRVDDDEADFLTSVGAEVSRCGSASRWYTTATPDSPRYKELGNAMSVTPMAWIGERIDRALKTRGIA